MKKILLVFASILLTVTYVSAGEMHYFSQYQSCLDNSGGVTSKMRTCSKKELAYQNGLLNKYYKQAMNKLDSVKRKELKQVQRSWMNYCAAKCGFDYGLTGGTIILVIGNGYLVNMIAKRVVIPLQYSA